MKDVPPASLGKKVLSQYTCRVF